MKKRQVLIIAWIIITSLYIPIHKTSEVTTLLYPLSSYSKSDSQEDLKLTVSINSRILKWDSFLTLDVSLKNTTSNKPVPNRGIELKAFVRSTIYLKVNISIRYFLIYEHITLSNETRKVYQFIPHVPTLFPYTFEATYNNFTTNTKLKVSFPFLILSDRQPMLPLITFEIFIILYILILSLACAILLINRYYNQKIEKKSN